MNESLTLSVNVHLHPDTPVWVESYDRRSCTTAFVSLEVGTGPGRLAVLVHHPNALANLAEAVENARTELARVLGETDAPDAPDPGQAVLPTAV